MPTRHAPSLVHLRRALEISEQIQKLEAELQAVLGGHASASAAPLAATATPAKKTRGRKKGWRKATDGQAAKKAAAAPKKASGQFTPEWRAKLAEAARQRWARVRAAK